MYAACLQFKIMLRWFANGPNSIALYIEERVPFFIFKILYRFDTQQIGYIILTVFRKRTSEIMIPMNCSHVAHRA